MKPYLRSVHYYETDRMGVVHHSNYIRWFEEARLALLEQLGISYADVEKDGILIPVVDVSCSYLRPVRYGDTVAVDTTLTAFTGVRMSFRYEVRFAESGQVACTGESSHCFLRDGAPVSVRRLHPQLYQKMRACLTDE